MAQSGALFDVTPLAVDINFDPNSNQQFLAFNFVLKASLPHLLEQLLHFQSNAGAPMVPPKQPAPVSVGSQGAAKVQQIQPQMQQAQLTQQVQQQVQQQQMQQQQVHQQSLQSMQLQLAPRTPHQQLLEAVAPLPGAVAAPAQAAVPASYATLSEAIRCGNVDGVQLALQRGADVNQLDSQQLTPLHCALESGGNVSIINMLMQGRSNVNAQTGEGTTPLHIAVRSYERIPSLVTRMLLCNQADLSLADAQGATPLDGARMVAMQAHQAAAQSGVAPVLNAQIRQLLSEMTERPTVAVQVHNNDVLNAYFSTVNGDRIVYHTSTSIGIFSLSKWELIAEKKLRQSQVRSSVKKVAVNMELGTIAACLEIVDTSQPNEGLNEVQNVSIIWPTGQLLDEEPLKLNVKLRPPDGHFPAPLPVDILLSRCNGPQMLLSRLGDGQVYCWRLNAARSQLVNEVKICDRGGLVALSDDGIWAAAVNFDGEGGADHVDGWAIDIWTCQDMKGATTVGSRKCATLRRKATCLAVASRGAGGQCLLSLAEMSPQNGPAASIEVIAAGLDGVSSTFYRVRPDMMCTAIHFCYRSPDHLLSAHADGVVVVYDLQRGTSTLSHDSAGMRCVNISADRTLLVSSEANYFRVFRVSAGNQ